MKSCTVNCLFLLDTLVKTKIALQKFFIHYKKFFIALQKFFIKLLTTSTKGTDVYQLVDDFFTIVNWKTKTGYISCDGHYQF